MEKKIKDYLHLYLGCGIVVEKAKENFNWVSENPTILTPHILNLQNEGGFSFKPTLRPLSDMTEDEAIELCKVYSPEAFGDYRFSKWVAVREKENFCYNVFNDRSDMSFNVDLEKMHIKVYEDGHDTYPGIENHTYFLEYLKRGFDLFGLIESGLAIDKSSLTPKHL